MGCSNTTGGRSGTTGDLPPVFSRPSVAEEADGGASAAEALAEEETADRSFSLSCWCCHRFGIAVDLEFSFLGGRGAITDEPGWARSYPLERVKIVSQTQAR